jgi:predicted DCC family thiol-disulfide oxidoreductase YuxK
MSNSRDIDVAYDQECPVCDFYCKRIDVQQSAGHLRRINARADSEIMDEITARGLDIDEGMVVRVGDRLYYGADAIHELALLSSGKGFLNAMSRLMFSSRRVSRALYPIFRFLRNMLLKILGRTRINNLQQADNEHF